MDVPINPDPMIRTCEKVATTGQYPCEELQLPAYKRA